MSSEQKLSKVLRVISSLLNSPNRSTERAGLWFTLHNIRQMLENEIAGKSVDPVISEYAKAHNRKDTLLYNNRIFFGYIRPSQRQKEEYDINRTWILAHFGHYVKAI